MKNVVYYLLVAVTCAGFAACSYSDKYELVNANNKFSVSVPSWMKEDKTLKQGADFQYANRFRNFYAIGETIDNSAGKANADIISGNLATLRKSLQKPMVTDSVEVTTESGVKGTRVEISGKMTGEDIYFSEVLFQGKKGLYHLSIWTRSSNRKLHFKEDINKIIASFKEI
jgi:hypothetical protein